MYRIYKHVRSSEDSEVPTVMQATLNEDSNTDIMKAPQNLHESRIKVITSRAHNLRLVSQQGASSSEKSLEKVVVAAESL
jgi:hypothetical protein